ncbi:MAG: hypothetical protein ABSG31_01970 [Tepidisphaeraceae bacterium]|jgi:hypothetical protein
MTASPPEPKRLWHHPLFGPAVVAIAAIAMFWWTWQTWCDLLIDFGVQLYVPWRLAAGEILYRDIAHYTGPLSIYYHALAFKIFGPSLRTLEFVELPTITLTFAAIYHIAQKLAGRLSAIVCGITFATMFAFAHLMPAGNYNFICPYEYEYTHGTLLSLGCILCLGRWMQKSCKLAVASAGFLTGMVFLTRAEFFVAIACASFAAFALVTLENPRTSLRGAVIFVIAMLVPPIISIALLALAMPISQAITGTLGMWPALLHGNVSGQQFYQHSMGTDDLRENVWQLFRWTCGYLIVIGVFGWAAKILKSKKHPAILLASAAAGAALIRFGYRRLDWISLFRPLPVVALICIFAALIILFIRRTDPARPRLVIVFAVFSFVSLGKVFLYARIEHYGCWLAMPATMLLIMALFGWFPTRLTTIGSSPCVFLAGVAGIWTGIIIVHLIITGYAISKLKTPVGDGPDQFFAGANADLVNQAITLAKQNIPPDQTLLCAPEGIMINYLSRRRTPTRYVNFNPPDLLLFGEQNMLTALQHSPPDFIMIVHKDTTEFGHPYFGRDYGRSIYDWIENHYGEAWLLGSEPLQGRHFGIRVMTRVGG